MIADLSNFLAMGKYATFVWPAYAAAAAVMAALWWTSTSSYRRNRHALDMLKRSRRRLGRAE